MTRLAELRALLASRETRRRDHSRACSCLDCEHAQCVLEQSALEALPALLDVLEAAKESRCDHPECCGTECGQQQLRTAVARFEAITDGNKVE